MRALTNLRLLASDDAGVDRATVAGVLLCTNAPGEWLPHATIVATRYKGRDRASGQLDAQDITGALYSQIEDTVKFVVRNMQVAAHKTPARENVPQYSTAAVFEAVVNAVAHRDYSMSSRRIRLSMFSDRLEIDSPGQLPNGLTIESMAASQATRNEVIASVFARIPVGDVPGAENRRYLMDLRGDGVSIILNETNETAGVLSEYKVVDESSLVLIILAANLVPTPADVTIAVHSHGEPLPAVDVRALFPNKTWLQRTTDEQGEAVFNLHSTYLPMTVYAAATGYSAGLKREWIPRQTCLVLELDSLPTGGSALFPQDSGHLSGLTGRLNPIRDASDRTYLYADNIAIEQGRQQPVSFRLGIPMQLTDAHGVELSVTIIDIVGRSALVDYRT